MQLLIEISYVSPSLESIYYNTVILVEDINVYNPFLFIIWLRFNCNL